MSRGPGFHAPFGNRDSGADSHGRAGRHRPPPTTNRKRAIIPIVVAVALLAVASAGYAITRTSSGGSAECGDKAVQLRVVASPVLAPILKRAAAAFDADQASRDDGPCTATSVTAQEPTAFGESLLDSINAGGGASAPTVWIPDASLWRATLARRPELSAVLPHAFPVIAASPVVMAVPRQMAEVMGWPGKQPTWHDLLSMARDPRGWGAEGHSEWGQVRIAWRDPVTSTTGLAATASVYDIVSRDAAEIDDVRRELLTAQSSLSTLGADPAKVLAPLRDSSLTAPEALRQTRIIPWTEREVLAFNASKPVLPLAAVYPRDGTISDEVPMITLGAKWVTDAQREATDRFAVFVVQGQAASELRAAGWRTPRLGTDATPARGALSTEPVYTPPTPNASTIARVLQGWTALDRQGSLLVVLDTSGSMNQKVPSAGNATRLALAKTAIQDSVPLFSDRTGVGLWTFSRSTTGGRDYTSVLPIGSLSRTVGGVTARQALRAAVDGVQAKGDTGLYDTIVAAAAAAKASWRVGNNTIVLVSDGKNEDPGSATLDQVVATLKKNADPRRPVRIISIALGDQADTAALRKISEATSGEAYAVRHAEDLEDVFLTALTD
jgi:Ca-activated chloride channel homolog